MSSNNNAFTSKEHAADFRLAPLVGAVWTASYGGDDHRRDFQVGSHMRNAIIERPLLPQAYLG